MMAERKGRNPLRIGRDGVKWKVDHRPRLRQIETLRIEAAGQPRLPVGREPGQKKYIIKI